MIKPIAVPIRRTRSVLASAWLLLLGAACAPEGSAYTTTAPRRTDRSPSQDPLEPTCPVFDAKYRDEFKACEVDADCTTVAVEVTCPGNEKAYGVAAELVDAFLECVPRVAGRVCRGSPEPSRAEDGRPSASDSLDDVGVRCTSGMCQTHIVRRACGEGGLICTDDEICVALQSASSAIEYECVANPCEGRALDCECAEPVCETTEGPRRCALESTTDSDVYCKTVRL